MEAPGESGIIPAGGYGVWRENAKGAYDTDLYAEFTGYGNDTEVTWWNGRNVGGVTIGLIQFRGNLPMMPGNMGNATTFDFPDSVPRDGGGRQHLRYLGR